MGEDVKGRGQRKRHCGPNKKQKVWTGVQGEGKEPFFDEGKDIAQVSKIF